MSNEEQNGFFAKPVLAAGFICQGCKHELPMDFNLRTEGFCYLCDPNITLAECLSDEPIERVPKACRQLPNTRNSLTKNESLETQK